MDSHSEAQETTCAEAIARLVARHELVGNRSVLVIKRIAKKHLLPTFGALTLAELNSARLEAFAAELKRAGKKPSTINRIIGPMRACYGLYGLPAPRFPRLRERNAREVFFERDQFEAVVRELPVPLQPPTWFAYFTGWRMNSEVLKLRWEWVDWTAGTIHLPAAQTKAQRARIFPFSVLPALAALLAEQRQRTPTHCPWIFHRFGYRPIKNHYRAWKAACQRAACRCMRATGECTCPPVDRRIPHDLRRTAARNLIRAGVPEKVVMQLVGWSTSAMLQRYFIVREDDLRAAVSALNGSNVVASPSAFGLSTPRL